LIVFCAAVWIGLRLAGYVEFDTARHLALTGTFRHIVNARLFVDGFERKAAAAATADDYWAIVREAVDEFGFPHVRMSLQGRVFEHGSEHDNFGPCCVVRIPFAGSDYVNFSCPARASVRHSVAITSIVPILQRSIAERSKNTTPAVTIGRLIPEQLPSRVAVHSWKTG